MILINLLPHREASRKRRQEEFQALMLASAVVGLLIAGGIYLYFQMLIEGQEHRNRYLTAEISKLDEQIKDVANIESEIASLRARQQAVENLQSDRNLPVHMLTELVRQLPDGAYITDLRQVDQVVTVRGMAQSNERVSEVLRNFSDNTPWFAKPELVEIVAGNVELKPKDNRRVPAFNMRFRLVRGADADKADDAGSTDAGG